MHIYLGAPPSGDGPSGSGNPPQPPPSGPSTSSGAPSAFDRVVGILKKVKVPVSHACKHCGQTWHRKSTRDKHQNSVPPR
jgi:hypothetical protein